MDAAKFDSLIASAPRRGDRIAWFGALLAKESRTDVEVVGGSAIEIYLAPSEYVSQDVDLVADVDRIAPVLRRWGFKQVEGRSHRLYWLHREIGLVDVVGPGDRSGLRPRRVITPLGPVLVSAVEPLIARRLVRAHRENSKELYRQAVQLAQRREVDWGYLDVIARYEGATELLKKLRSAVRSRSRKRRAQARTTH